MADFRNTMRNCGALAVDALTLGAISKAVEREKITMNLRMAFPEDWETLLSTMDRFDRASTGKPSMYIKQMWAMGICAVDEAMALHSACPAAFCEIPLAKVIGRKPSEVLPKLAAALP